MVVNSVKKSIFLTGSSGIAALSVLSGMTGVAHAQGDLRTHWQAVQHSSVSDDAKIRSTVTTYFEIPLSDRNGQPFTLRDFLIKDNQDLKNYMNGLLNMQHQSWQLWDAWSKSYTYDPNIEIVDITGDTAIVSATPEGSYVTEGNVTLDLPEVTHTLSLKKGAGTWYITDDSYTDYFLEDYGSHPDWAKIMSNAPEEVQQIKDAQNQPKQKLVDPNLTKMSVNSVTPQTTTMWSYDGTAASNYGYNFTAEGTGNDTSSYNGNFQHYTGNDCQNFVSQCIWAGFGGSNATYNIQNHSLPMITSGNQWWEDNTNHDPNGNWTLVFAFASMIKNNTANNSIGVHGADMGTGGAALSSLSIGDYIEDTSGNGHVLLYSAGSAQWGPTNGGMMVDAHSNNHRDKSLYDVYGDSASIPSVLHFMHIYGELVPSGGI